MTGDYVSAIYFQWYFEWVDHVNCGLRPAPPARSLARSPTVRGGFFLGRRPVLASAAASLAARDFSVSMGDRGWLAGRPLTAPAPPPAAAGSAWPRAGRAARLPRPTQQRRPLPAPARVAPEHQAGSEGRRCRLASLIPCWVQCGGGRTGGTGGGPLGTTFSPTAEGLRAAEPRPVHVYSPSKPRDGQWGLLSEASGFYEIFKAEMKESFTTARKNLHEEDTWKTVEISQSS
ncbi:uncharacterized protein [Tiliqua scincoides]|uniref:uncharacterized protein n=1 Tax=Tiliqua scincoides TaxID=71010 RepID=UPI0034631AD6